MHMSSKNTTGVLRVLSHHPVPRYASRKDQQFFDPFPTNSWWACAGTFRLVLFTLLISTSLGVVVGYGLHVLLRGGSSAESCVGSTTEVVVRGISTTRLTDAALQSRLSFGYATATTALVLYPLPWVKLTAASLQAFCQACDSSCTVWSILEGDTRGPRAPRSNVVASVAAHASNWSDAGPSSSNTYYTELCFGLVPDSDPQKLDVCAGFTLGGAIASEYEETIRSVIASTSTVTILVTIRASEAQRCIHTLRSAFRVLLRVNDTVLANSNDANVEYLCNPCTLHDVACETNATSVLASVAAGVVETSQYWSPAPPNPTPPPPPVPIAPPSPLAPASLLDSVQIDALNWTLQVPEPVIDISAFDWPVRWVPIQPAFPKQAASRFLLELVGDRTSCIQAYRMSDRVACHVIPGRRFRTPSILVIELAHGDAGDDQYAGDNLCVISKLCAITSGVVEFAGGTARFNIDIVTSANIETILVPSVTYALEGTGSHLLHATDAPYSIISSANPVAIRSVLEANVMVLGAWNRVPVPSATYRYDCCKDTTPSAPPSAPIAQFTNANRGADVQHVDGTSSVLYIVAQETVAVGVFSPALQTGESFALYGCNQENAPCEDCIRLCPTSPVMQTDAGSRYFECMITHSACCTQSNNVPVGFTLKYVRAATGASCGYEIQFDGLSLVFENKSPPSPLPPTSPSPSSPPPLPSECTLIATRTDVLASTGKYCRAQATPQACDSSYVRYSESLVALCIFNGNTCTAGLTITCPIV